ncbi:GNAT family N-acetyltransferase [Roseivivax isoporae]|uniref:GNAT family N-acetyltransferase n=1 Tax=Roseivivax isoporae TaxID=591206 RepID=UPI0004B21BE1|nr:GNAT family N-acetyltransferase [Roseivivax isoporae]
MSVTFRDIVPSDADWLVPAHAVHYAREEGFDDTFGALVADILAAFLRERDPDRERAWIAEEDGRPLGSIFCVPLDEHTAKLRLFLLLPEARGRGLGRQMLALCTEWARARGYARMVLWTHESHRAACALYARTGWSLESSKPVHSFGQDLVEQHWSIALR